MGGFGPTGPATGQPMRRWLAITGVLEILNGVVVLPAFTWLMGEEFPGLVGPFVWLGVVTLGLILIEGGMYWLLKRDWFERTPASVRLRGLREAYVASIALLCVFPALLVAVLLVGAAPRADDLALGTFWYLFGVGEFVHYFMVKITMRGRELRRLLRTGRPIPARFRREVRRAVGQIARAAAITP